MVDAAAVRRLFPHTGKTVYFNTASVGPQPDPACQIQEAYFRRTQMVDIGNQAEIFAALDNIRKNGAKIFGGKKSEIGFGFNTTFGINLAAFGLPLKSGDEVLLSHVEFPANVYPWLELRRRGVRIKFIKSPDGFLKTDSIVKMITKRTRVLSVSFVQYFNGFKPDMDALAEVCRRHGIYLVLDSIQGAGCEPLDVHKWDVASASAGAQKWLLSPQGTGLFYVSEQMQERLHAPWRSWLSVDWKCRWHDLRRFNLDYDPSARQYELGTYPGALVLSFDWTLEYMTRLGIRAIQRHNHGLLDILIGYLRQEDFYRITSSLVPKHRSSILTFTTDRGDISAVHQFLLKNKIVTALREGSIRVSAHIFNDRSDVEELIDGLGKAAGRFGRK